LIQAKQVNNGAACRRNLQVLSTDELAEVELSWQGRRENSRSAAKRGIAGCGCRINKPCDRQAPEFDTMRYDAEVGLPRNTRDEEK
jgi:hypothetical protein